MSEQNRESPEQAALRRQSLELEQLAVLNRQESRDNSWLGLAEENATLKARVAELEGQVARLRGEWKPRHIGRLPPMPYPIDDD